MTKPADSEGRSTLVRLWSSKRVVPSFAMQEESQECGTLWRIQTEAQAQRSFGMIVRRTQLLARVPRLVSTVRDSAAEIASSPCAWRPW
jgi:hypothetical protein